MPPAPGRRKKKKKGACHYQRSSVKARRREEEKHGTGANMISGGEKTGVHTETAKKRGPQWKKTIKIPLVSHAREPGTGRLAGK